MLLAGFELGGRPTGLSTGDGAIRLTLDTAAVRLAELSRSGTLKACVGLVSTLADAVTAATGPARALDAGESAAIVLGPEISSIAPTSRTAQPVDSRALQIFNTVVSNIFLRRNRQRSGAPRPPMQPDVTSIGPNTSGVYSAGHLVGASGRHGACRLSGLRAARLFLSKAGSGLVAFTRATSSTA